MHTVAQVLKTHPSPRGIRPDQRANLIASLSACAYACQACADACLGEEKVEAVRTCISLDLACAEICHALGRILIQQTAPNEEVVQALAHAAEVACRLCAEECEMHAEMHGHCKHCAEACRQCENTCRDLAA